MSRNIPAANLTQETSPEEVVEEGAHHQNFTLALIGRSSQETEEAATSVLRARTHGVARLLDMRGLGGGAGRRGRVREGWPRSAEFRISLWRRWNRRPAPRSMYPSSCPM